MTWKLLGFEINENFFYLLESMKVEGYWSVKRREATIQNKNIHLIKRIEKVLKENKIKFRRRLLIKIKPKRQRFSKSKVRVIQNGKEIRFHIERSPFDGSKKIVFKLPYKKKQKFKLFFLNKKYENEVKVGSEKIQFKSPFVSYGYLEIRFHNVNLIRLFDILSLNKKKSKEIRLNYKILTSPKYVAAAFSAVVDCEGSIDFYNYIRRIRIRMFNPHYLIDWQKILARFNIKSRYDRKEGLVIEGWEDFERLQKLGLNLFHSEKRKKWYKILNSYKKKQVSRNTAMNYYLNELIKIGKPISSSEFAKHLNKSKRVVNHYLTKLARKNLLKIDKSNVTWLYAPKKLSTIKS